MTFGRLRYVTAILKVEYQATECSRLYVCVYVCAYIQAIWVTALNAVRVHQKASHWLQSQFTEPTV